MEGSPPNYARYACQLMACLLLAPPVLAQEAPSGRSVSTLEEIIVTARRREERLQETPISITVFNQGQIDNRNIQSASDLAIYTPSLFSDNRFTANNSVISIRGFRQELRTTATVGVYFADVVAPRGGNAGIPAGDGAGRGDFFDLQNVQVLKGPQGTLFGRNTTGGALVLVPQKPVDEFEGYIEGSLGTYDMHRIQGVVNTPLGDRARLRLGVDHQDRDGYLRNVSGIGPDRFGDVKYTALRASLVVDLTDNLENYTIARYSNSKDSGPLPKVTRCSAEGIGLLGCAQIAEEAPHGHYAVSNNILNPKTKLEQWQVINTLTWTMNDNLTAKHIASYSELNGDMTSSIFGVSLPVGPFRVPFTDTGPPNALGVRQTSQQNVTQELQLQGTSFDDRLDWQTGLYYENSRPKEYSGSTTPTMLVCEDASQFHCIDILAQAFGAPAVGSLAMTQGGVTIRNLGVYAQGTYALTDRLNTTIGLRYTEDKMSGYASTWAIRFFQPNVPTILCNFPGTEPDCAARSNTKSDAVTGTIGFEFQATDDVMLYAKYSRGYRQGQVSMNAPPSMEITEPEDVDAYEIGAKTSFYGPVSGTFNVALFHNKLKNAQQSITGVSSQQAAAPTLLILNVAEAEINGAEVETVLHLTDQFHLSGSYAYLDTEIKSFTAPSVPADSPYDIFESSLAVGSDIPLSPKNQLSITGTYHVPIAPELGDLSVAATYSYNDSYTYTHGPYGKVDSVGLLNLNLNWHGIAGSPVDFSLFGTNVTDKRYFTTVNDFVSAAGFVSQAYGEPRMFGARLRYSF